MIERTVDFASGEPAVTHYERLACRNGLSFLKFWLETGRTHQMQLFPMDIAQQPKKRRCHLLSQDILADIGKRLLLALFRQHMEQDFQLLSCCIMHDHIRFALFIIS